MPTENQVAEFFIETTLLNDTTLTSLIGTNVYGYQIDQDSTFPAIVYNFQSPYKSGDVMAVGTTRIMTNALYLIKAVSTSSMSED